MKKLLYLFIALMSATAFGQTSGGPDAFGYTWRNQLDAQGPTYNWIDITTSGTLVTGLTDDNATAMIPMGTSFHYYWSDYSSLVIGSNGWLSFNSIANIAHCFPTIPTAGGAGDNILAPMMTDLIMTGSGNPAEVYYYNDVANQRFIVSYINCPWWTANAPGYVGSNTFQVILSNADSSITFQYQTTDPANFNNTPTCAADLEIGIENITGNIGLELFNDALPASGSAYKFYYPATVLIAVPDATPSWAMNIDNGGVFFGTNSAMDINVNISNVGNADITSDIIGSYNLLAPGPTLFWNGSDTIVGGLVAGTSQLSSFTSLPTPTTGGQYTLISNISNSQDINPSNNGIQTEVNFVNLSQPKVALSYVNGNVQNGNISWTGGGGMASYFTPPVYPIVIDSVGFGLNITTQGLYYLEIIADDGVAGGPGTILYQDSVTSNTAGSLAWETHKISVPVQISSGGFYVAWKDNNGNTISTTTTAPISKRSWEYVGGNWAQFRSNDAQDLFIKAVFTQPCQSLVATASQSNVSCNGLSDGSVTLSTTGGTAPYTENWGTANPTALAAGNYSYTVTDGGGCSTVGIVTITQPAVLASNPGTSVNVSCNGMSDGSITLATTGGTAPYTENWGTANPTALAAGSYSYTVTDANGCTANGSATITEPTALTSSGTTQNAVGSNNGSIDLSASGGTAPYTFLWSNSETTEDISGLAAGSYAVTISDANGCTDTTSFVISFVVGVNQLHVDKTMQVYPNPSSGLVQILVRQDITNAIQFELFNVLGAKVPFSITQNGAVYQMTILDAAPGLYILRGVGDHEIFTKELIIKK